jgi:hypothetical protein
MSTTANKNVPPVEYAPLDDPKLAEGVPYNTKQKARKLVNIIQHKHNYGIAIHAQQLIKVTALQAELVELGLPPLDLITPDFSREDLWEQYAALSNYKI